MPDALTAQPPQQLSDDDESHGPGRFVRLTLLPFRRVGPGLPNPLSAPAVSSRRVLNTSARTITAIGLVALLFVGYEFLLTGLTHARMDAALLAAFKKAVPTTTLGLATELPAEGGPVALLTIPQIGLDQVVVEGTSQDDLKADPGHLRNSPLPGEYGNAVIAGRRTTYGGPLRELDRLHRGDQVKVTTGQGSFVYDVASVRSVSAGDVAPLANTQDSRLTLITSDPVMLASGRLVVDARLKGTPVAVPNRPPAPIAAGDLGLAGEPIGLALALLFGQLLALTSWVARRMRRRWPRGVVHLLFGPVVVALTVLAFSNLDRMLPGTL